MDEATRHLRALARQIVDAALERVPLRAALLAGSAGRGDADFWSDLDLLMYVDHLPPQETLAEIRKAVGGTKPIAMHQKALAGMLEALPLYGEELVEHWLWRVDMLLQAAFNLLGVLAGLNRLYFARFELKRTRALISRMELAPPALADRLESLFRLEPAPAAAELGRLVEETRALVAQELPDVELSLEFPPSARQRPWRT